MCVCVCVCVCICVYMCVCTLASAGADEILGRITGETDPAFGLIVFLRHLGRTREARQEGED